MDNKIINELFNKRLLRKIPFDIAKIENSLKIAESKLLRSKKLLDKNFFDECFLVAYTSMFYASRALFYKSGIQEKSHYAVYVYIREMHKSKMQVQLIESFKNYQLERHNILYLSPKEISKEEAAAILSDANEFLLEVKKILENDKKL